MEDNERIRPTEFEDHLFEVLARVGRDRRASAFATGHGYTTNPRVGNNVGDLLVAREDIDIRVCRKSSVVEDPLHRECRLGTLWRVLEQDSIANHEVGCGEPCDLIVRVVPRHDAQYRANWCFAYPRGAVGLRWKGRVG